MKIIKLLLLVLLFTTYSFTAFGQITTKADSIEFCGKHFIAPKDCETIGNMIKCKDYVFTWIYEPVKDLPRHQKELLAQIKKPKKQNVSVLNTDLIGYLSKAETFESLVIIGEVNGKGVIISLFVKTAIKSTADLPEFIRQLITIK